MRGFGNGSKPRILQQSAEPTVQMDVKRERNLAHPPCTGIDTTGH